MTDDQNDTRVAANVNDVLVGLDVAGQLLLYSTALNRIANGVYDPALVARQALAAATTRVAAAPQQPPG